MIGADNPPPFVPGKFSGTPAADFFQIPNPVKENSGDKKI
jgi:hypothetical protein